MKDILHKIIDHKKREIADRKRVVTQQTMLHIAQSVQRPTLSMSRSLESSPSGIIAEFKRRSPSKGWINRSADAAEVVGGYRSAGAAACSVLTDAEFFGGNIDDLIAASQVASEESLSAQLPLLRKEFIIDPYQILEARAAGADAILLIASCLSSEQCRELASTAHSLSLEVLLEIHTDEELSHLNNDIDMLGVNNRNLGTFHTDIQNSFRLARAMAEHSVSISRRPTLVSESGISDAQTIKELRKAGFRGFLIGETFMKNADPAAALSDLITQLQC